MEGRESVTVSYIPIDKSVAAFAIAFFLDYVFGEKIFAPFFGCTSSDKTAEEIGPGIKSYIYIFGRINGLSFVLCKCIAGHCCASNRMEIFSL